MDVSIAFSVIAAAVSLGGILIAVGVFKGRINQTVEDNKAQEERIKTLASKEDLAGEARRSKDELASAIRRSDELLALLTKRTEEDRAKGQGQWREFYESLTKHAERISIVEHQQTILMRAIDELKEDIKSGFNEMKKELKELRGLR